MTSFLAIDFETANYASNSACAIGLVRVVDGIIVTKSHHLIKPPSPEFTFTHIHGIRWHDVSNSLSFANLWPEIMPLFDGIDFLCAHNASFDRKVLQSTAETFGLQLPNLDWVCTVQVARRAFKIYPTTLPHVCSKLNISLKHHEALSDAEACAQIVIKAENKSRDLSDNNTIHINGPKKPLTAMNSIGHGNLSTKEDQHE